MSLLEKMKTSLLKGPKESEGKTNKWQVAMKSLMQAKGSKAHNQNLMKKMAILKRRLHEKVTQK